MTLNLTLNLNVKSFHFLQSKEEQELFLNPKNYKPLKKQVTGNGGTRVYFTHLNIPEHQFVSK